ncbi:PREDICTED: putative uncharacterized protein DDB_G0286751 isoform X2 [Nicrophorus vespilloides]|uniref:Uncharacterized protein n=1 Tax=Nicrophorus vespilloides TaxID=110193 RepID=A0ABM1MBB2_NICVS|nr:PREDICTED: putative uncharacterized protein DDB_G0286751 isoform X2 [Nicrophorus vespilloides]
MLMLNYVLLVCAALCIAKDEINLKNATAKEDKEKSKSLDHPLRTEVRKYLKECGADVSDGDESSEEETKVDRMDVRRRGTYPENYSAWYEENQKKNKRKDRNNRRGNKNNQYDDYEDGDNDDEGGCNSGNGNNRNNRNRGRNKNRNGGNRNGNQDRNRNKGNNNNKNNRNEYNRYDPYGNRYDGNEDFGLYGWGSNRGYSLYGGRMMLLPNRTEENARTKRHNDDDFQCLSQCVFGYLGMLDDDRVPSETELTKFIQNSVQNSSKRMQAIRDARRCFATLSASDTEDGCKFSKLLGNCLKLEIPDYS